MIDLKLDWAQLPEALEEGKRIEITLENSESWANKVSQNAIKFYTDYFDAGTIIYVNSKNELHRLTGPAIEGKNQSYREWYLSGDYIGSDRMDFNQEKFEEFLKQKDIISSLKFIKQADLYNNILYTIVPKDMSLEYGIYPDDQKFHRKYVLLWDTYDDLLSFDSDKWKRLKVIIPKDAKFGALHRIMANAYGIEHIPNSWAMVEQSINPPYNE